MKTPTFTLSTLDKPESFLEGIKLVAADIDYTLVDFDKGNEAGLQAVAETLGQSVADKTEHFFRLTLDGFRRSSDEPWEAREEFNQFIADAEKAQEKFIPDYGPRVWSRETYLRLSDRSLTKDQLIEGRDSYWRGVSEGNELYPDVITFLDYLKTHSIPLILMTGSDSVLVINDDLTFDYDPDFAAEYKQKRLRRFPFNAHEIVTGDPIDKPDEAFYTRVLDSARQLGQFSHNEVLFMGDSLRNDLEVPGDLGYRTLLVKR